MMDLPLNHARATARRASVKVFRRVNAGDITIRHHWTGEPLRLHSFKHKGYWYHAASRERATMIAFAQLISPGDEVVEVGAHIGYIAMWLARLVGPCGRLLACEPGTNNLPYLRRNLADTPWATISEVAVADADGEREFLEEEFTGQNNSLRTDSSQFEKTMALNHMTVDSRIRLVRTETLDGLLERTRMSPALVKIDVEGAELDVLRGASRTLSEDQPALVVEVAYDHDEVDRLLRACGYIVLDASFEVIGAMRAFNLLNYICLHRERHRDLIEHLSR